jgi:hypothetical protein
MAVALVEQRDKQDGVNGHGGPMLTGAWSLATRSSSRISHFELKIPV